MGCGSGAACAARKPLLPKLADETRVDACVVLKALLVDGLVRACGLRSVGVGILNVAEGVGLTARGGRVPDNVAVAGMCGSVGGAVAAVAPPQGGEGRGVQEDVVTGVKAAERTG